MSRGVGVQEDDIAALVRPDLEVLFAAVEASGEAIVITSAVLGG
jgi:hypothetical protein